MSLKYHPEAGAVLICDFRGFIDPEINKKRPVIVVSPRSRAGNRLCAVVPISTTQPQRRMPWHLEYQFTDPLPEPYSQLNVWIKADLIYTVSFDRLSVPVRGKNADGTRCYESHSVGPGTLSAVRTAIQNALGILT